MQASEPLAIPAARASEALGDLSLLERIARERGLQFRRVPDDETDLPAWDVELPAGIPGDRLRLSLAQSSPDGHLEAVAQMPKLEARCGLQVTELAPEESRLDLTLAVQPSGLTMRVFVASLSLPGVSIADRLVRLIAREVEAAAR